MPTPFPGMDPFLEQAGVWEEFHTRLIVALADELGPRLRPRYRVSVEQRTYLAVDAPPEPVGKPDVLITTPPAPSPRPPATPPAPPAIGALALVAELPMPGEVVERFLEVRDVATSHVITVIELLSRSNKLAGEGRWQYERKRLAVLASATHLVEIDLLRGGAPMSMRLPPGSGPADYRIVVSRAWDRPKAEVYLVGLRERIPDLALPLARGDLEPRVPLNDLVHAVYERAGFDLVVNYDADLRPPVDPRDHAWIRTVIADHRPADARQAPPASPSPPPMLD